MNFIGTSGWMYKHWLGNFYPKETSSKDFFASYSERFPTVELNTTFYHLPLDSTIRGWRDKAPEGFVYAVKASRYITHTKRLLDAREQLETFLARVEPLEEHLGPILFQTPPSLKRDLERLREFLKILPKNHRYTFEFRHGSWFNEEVYALLRSHNVALCIYDLNRYTSPLIVTDDFVYLRLHGPRAAYRDAYSTAQLEEWASFIEKVNKKGRDAYCYFDNDMGGHAPVNALELKELLA